LDAAPLGVKGTGAVAGGVGEALDIQPEAFVAAGAALIWLAQGEVSSLSH